MRAAGIKDKALKKAVEVWTEAPPLLSLPRNKREYETMVKVLDILVDIAGEDEAHPYARAIDTLGVLIHAYEEEHLDLPTGDPVETLRFLMEEHGLKQKDLGEEIGSQGHVSQILNRKRSLTLQQIRALAERFNVSQAVFI
ncbi:MAG: helix-turn-helix domain-containing protein [Nitrospinae bacterium]|nr:helix-turn-helix domain-containing protein [Nitrospinota bacterium]